VSAGTDAGDSADSGGPADDSIFSVEVVPGEPALLRVDKADSPLYGLEIEFDGDELAGAPIEVKVSRATDFPGAIYGEPLAPAIRLEPAGTKFLKPVVVRTPFSTGKLEVRKDGGVHIGMLRREDAGAPVAFQWAYALDQAPDGSLVNGGPGADGEGPWAVEFDVSNASGDARLVFGIMGFSEWEPSLPPLGRELLPNEPWPGEPPAVQILKIDCENHIDCYDFNNCTTEWCVMGKCDRKDFPEGAECNDGNPLTIGESCQNRVCSGGTSVECAIHADCFKQCFVGKCVEHVCVPDEYLETEDECDDLDPCTDPDFCDGSVCNGIPKACEDGNQCTWDECDYFANGCTHEPLDGATCNDLDEDTMNDVCVGDVCEGEWVQCVEPAECDDANQCTGDDCIEGVCDYTPLNGTDCEDGDAETTTEKCQWGVCETPAVMCTKDSECNDEDFCTEDKCKFDWCWNTPKGDVPCDDGDPMTYNDTCAGGSCLGWGRNCMEDPECEDNNPCTKDTCEFAGCKWDPAPQNGADCSDDDECTTTDKCEAGKCTGPKKKCDTPPLECMDLPGVCHSPEGLCEYPPKPDGTDCKGGLCQSGQCKGSKCKCQDPDTTLDGSKCDWPDGDECSGWHSVAMENGRDYQAEFDDGTELCAYGCCISILCNSKN